jgi:membrane-associated phospholipid phosphatase
VRGPANGATGTTAALWVRPPSLDRSSLRLVASVLVAWSLCLGPLAEAQEAVEPTPTSRNTGKPLFTPLDLVALGSFAVMTVAITPADQKLARFVQDSGLQNKTVLRRSASFVREVATPGSVIIGTTLYVVGQSTENEKMAELGLHGLEALAVGGAVTFVAKGLVGRARPYVGLDNPRNFGLGRGFTQEDYRSFPSGHTVMAFAAAAAVTSTTDRWWPHATWYIAPAMYGGATLAGVSRMYNNKHWASDVVVGAAIGTFAGLKIVRYHDSDADNWIDKTFLSISLPIDERGAGGLSFSLIPAAAVRPLAAPR